MMDLSSGDFKMDLSSGDFMTDLSSGDFMIDLSSGDFMIDLSSGDFMIDLSSGDFMIDLSSGDFMIDINGVRECQPWCSIVGATVTVHQFFCILHYSIPHGLTVVFWSSCQLRPSYRYLGQDCCVIKFCGVFFFLRYFVIVCAGFVAYI